MHRILAFVFVLAACKGNSAPTPAPAPPPVATTPTAPAKPTGATDAAAFRDDVRLMCRTEKKCADDEYGDRGRGCDAEHRTARLKTLALSTARGKQLVSAYVADHTTDVLARAAVEVGLGRSDDCSISMGNHDDVVPTGTTPEFTDLAAMCKAIAVCNGYDGHGVECTPEVQTKEIAKLHLTTDLAKRLAAKLATRKAGDTEAAFDGPEIGAFAAEALDQGLLENPADDAAPCHNLLYGAQQQREHDANAQTGA